MQTHADACRRMQTHADACRRMQTHADACRRMQTHADACRRLQTHRQVAWRICRLLQTGFAKRRVGVHLLRSAKPCHLLVMLVYASVLQIEACRSTSVKASVLAALRERSRAAHLKSAGNRLVHRQISRDRRGLAVQHDKLCRKPSFLQARFSLGSSWQLLRDRILHLAAAVVGMLPPRPEHPEYFVKSSVPSPLFFIWTRFQMPQRSQTQPRARTGGQLGRLSSSLHCLAPRRQFLRCCRRATESTARTVAKSAVV